MPGRGGRQWRRSSPSTYAPAALVTTVTAHVVLIGPMGSGKTSVGRRLAERLGLPIFDTDDRIEADHGRTSGAIAAADGVEALHGIELAALIELASAEEPSVIACAASVVDEGAGREALRRNLSVWLDADADVLAERRRFGVHRRPVDEQEASFLATLRGPHLAECTITRVDTSGRSIDDVVDEVADVLATHRS